MKPNEKDIPLAEVDFLTIFKCSAHLYRSKSHLNNIFAWSIYELFQICFGEEQRERCHIEGN